MPPSGSGPELSPRDIESRERQVDYLLAESKVALAAKQLEKAAQAAEIATRISPGRADAWVYLFAALDALGSADLERAIANGLRHIGEDHPLAAALNADRARTLAGHGRWQEAAELAHTTAIRQDLSPQAHTTLALTLSQIGLYSDSLHHARLGAAGSPGSSRAFYALGSALRYLGQNVEARTAFERVIELNPGDSLALASMAAMLKAAPEDNRIPQMRAAIANAPGSEAEARLRHALFKELDDLGRHEEAWPELVEAAQTARKVFTFDAGERNARTTALIENFPTTAFNQLPVSVPPNRPRPIFVFGLPRSGTTITERVLAAHSRVTALGETPSFSEVVKKAVGEFKKKHPSVEGIRSARSLDWSIVSNQYLGNISFLVDGADTFTEKTPHNYEFAGPIALAFPDAVMVHVRRGPMDSLFGTYRLLFGEGGYHWSYTFEDLAENYRQYRRIMDHWRTCLGDRLVEVTLEELVKRPETEIRRLLMAVRLDFETACLSPEKNDAGVSTASATQIRLPINNQGVGRWRAYARQLEPLRAELERDGFVDHAGDPVWE